ncbi:hypothetical protein AB1N83_008744 [Pleurotus pulmonarius]
MQVLHIYGEPDSRLEQICERGRGVLYLVQTQRACDPNYHTPNHSTKTGDYWTASDHRLRTVTLKRNS